MCLSIEYCIVMKSKELCMISSRLVYEMWVNNLLELINCSDRPRMQVNKKCMCKNGLNVYILTADKL